MVKEKSITCMLPRHSHSSTASFFWFPFSFSQSALDNILEKPSADLLLLIIVAHLAHPWTRTNTHIKLQTQLTNLMLNQGTMLCAKRETLWWYS